MKALLRKEPLSIQAYNVLKKQILKGYFEPGGKVVETKLAELLNISRGPIREALRMLIQDGLLVQENSVIRVYDPSSKDFIDVYQCRESLEILALQLTINNISEVEKEKLKLIVKESKILQSQESYDELSNLDEEFHQIIVNASGNMQLIQLMEVIRAKITFMLGLIVHKNFYLPPIEHHEKILSALLNNDVEGAIKQMKIHLKYGLDCLLENHKD